MITYNRYVRMDNGDYTRITIEEPASPKRVPNTPHRTVNKVPPEPPPAPSEPIHRPIEARAANRILEHLHLGDIDSGDLLLLSVLFFLFRQDADEELLMALGLLLIL